MFTEENMPPPTPVNIPIDILRLALGVTLHLSMTYPAEMWVGPLRQQAHAPPTVD